MTQNTQANPSPNRRRYSERVDHRRGLQDGMNGRSPASMAPAYKAGYAEGRRRSHRRRRNETPRGVDGPVPRPIASVIPISPARASRTPNAFGADRGRSRGTHRGVGVTRRSPLFEIDRGSRGESAAPRLNEGEKPVGLTLPPSEGRPSAS